MQFLLLLAFVCSCNIREIKRKHLIIMRVNVIQKGSSTVHFNCHSKNCRTETEVRAAELRLLLSNMQTTDHAECESKNRNEFIWSCRRTLFKCLNFATFDVVQSLWISSTIWSIFGCVLLIALTSIVCCKSDFISLWPTQTEICTNSILITVT